LLEVLVAILIFSFGILGLVGLQANMINEQSAAKYRSDAGYLAGELTGLIWADVTNIGSYAVASGLAIALPTRAARTGPARLQLPCPRVRQPW